MKRELCENYEKVLHKGCTLQCILELKGLMIQLSENNNEIYPCIKTHQIRYIEEKILDVHLDNYSFLDSEVEIKVSEMPKKSALQKLEETVNNTSEEETEEGDDEEEDDDNEDDDDEDDDDDDKNNMDKLLENNSDTSDSDDELLRKIAKEESSESEKAPKNQRRKFI